MGLVKLLPLCMRSVLLYSFAFYNCLLKFVLVIWFFSLVFQNMWDLTPDTYLLKELPQTYSFETALADLIVSFSEKLP